MVIDTSNIDVPPAVHVKMSTKAVLVPVEAQNKSDLPVLVDPIDAQSKIIEHNSVPHETKNENQIWFQGWWNHSAVAPVAFCTYNVMGVEQVHKTTKKCKMISRK